MLRSCENLGLPELFVHTKGVSCEIPVYRRKPALLGRPSRAALEALQTLRYPASRAQMVASAFLKHLVVTTCRFEAPGCPAFDRREAVTCCKSAAGILGHLGDVFLPSSARTGSANSLTSESGDAEEVTMKPSGALQAFAMEYMIYITRKTTGTLLAWLVAK